ncbi:MAG: chromosome segregation protein SMC, partial [Pseudomonadota bacterium]
ETTARQANCAQPMSRHVCSLAERENRLQASIAEQRKAEAGIEESRERLAESSEAFNEVQGRYYKVGAEIARLEQSIEHNREMRQRQQADLERAASGLAEIAGHIEKDADQLEQLQLTLSELEPGLDDARERERASAESLQSAEQAMAQWQEEWETFNREASEAERLVQVENTRTEQLQQRLERLESRATSLSAERDAIPLPALREAGDAAQAASVHARAALEQAETVLSAADKKLNDTREAVREASATVNQERSALQTMLGRFASLEALQKAALGESTNQIGEWLKNQALSDAPRLAQSLRVSDGWDRAVETVLGSYLQAVCVDDVNSVVRELSSLSDGALTIVETGGTGAATQDGRLTSVVARAPAAVSHLLSNVVIAETLQDALAIRARLAPEESVITKEGVWLSPYWVRVSRGEDTRAGVLAREKEIRDLEKGIRGKRDAVADAEKSLSAAESRIEALEAERDELRQAAAQANRQAAEATTAVDSATLRLTQAEQRAKANTSALDGLAQESAEARQQIANSQQVLEQNRLRITTVAEDRQRLEERRTTLRAELDRSREQAAQDRAAARDLAISYESRRSSRESAEQGLERMRRQLEQYQQRKNALEQEIEKAKAPVAAMQRTLEEQLAMRVDLEKELGGARQHVENAEAQLRQLEQRRADHEQTVVEARDALNEAKMAGQETKVREEGLMEQFTATQFALQEIRDEMPEEATIDLWVEKLEKTQRRIDRLGPINLAAIEEFKEQAERKNYLDAQLEDLNGALTTLENAIRKIDRETRNRFKETYDQVNSGFQRLFPKLFGGGQAYLELTGDDLLAAGVTVMARPPGKRNSTIHLLSGGEKALTAVALVFAIFELNPAPFCMLDEVDAPLDDANVGRFCNIVKEMSETVQFVFISHNKATMEMAQQLMGVTMNEPGVSRLVAVDIDEAVKMAAA